VNLLAGNAGDADTRGTGWFIGFSEFCEAPDFRSSVVETVVLHRHGDSAAWGAGLFHRWHCESRSTVLTLRWNDS
jgi:hypothetical protein